ncbi:MAG: peptidoglycan binding domain-containing protein, partial [Anaerolineales bacterium]|nr:peptidoglycan binding domain-containing protein [Anaerolineales bacterium]
MQATSTIPVSPSWGRKLTYFLVIPLTAFALFTLAAAVTFAGYQNQHDGRIFTGVTVWGVDLGGMTPAEAKAALTAAFPYPDETAVTFTDPGTGAQWQKTPAELGLTFAVDDTINEAMAVGRDGSPLTRLRAIFDAWYVGQALPPVIVFDEGQLDQVLSALAADIDRPAVNASFDVQETSADYQPGQLGRQVDVTYLRERLLQPITDFRSADVQLLVHETMPVLMDDTAVAAAMEQMTLPMYFYFPEPLENEDLGYVELSTATLVGWVRVELQEQPDGSMQHRVFLDENAARSWLQGIAPRLYREPVRARFYFDDDTGELVLVAPHVNGRELDIEATLSNLLAQVGTSNRHVPVVLQEIVPLVSSDATASELGITELITETTTWFYGSSDERKHNIARAAANFFGVVIAPGEEFSFNRYLGTVSEADGYAEGFIIIGGQTIQGVGGGVCQVS